MLCQPTGGVSLERADDCVEFAAEHGLVLDPWQVTVVEAWMGTRLGEDGRPRWAAGRCGVAVPRQNGKNGALEAVELYMAVVMGLRIMHTAHEVKTAQKHFRRLRHFFGERVADPSANFPDINGLVTEIRKTNGQEAILLDNGGAIEIAARSTGSGRGFTNDILVGDEAQQYGEDAQAALLPTISSAPSGDPMQILLGTPPSPKMDGSVFMNMRQQGVAGDDDRLAWVEWSIEKPAEVDIYDSSVWAEANPALGGRLLLSVVRDESRAMSPPMFARERLGVWDSDGVLAAVPWEAWESCRTSLQPPAEARRVYAVDMTPDGATASITVAVEHDGRRYVDLVKRDSTADGAQWVVEFFAARERRRAGVVIDQYSPARMLVPKLEAVRARVTVTGGPALTAACGSFLDAVKSRTLAHYDAEPLNAAVQSAARRVFRDGGGWAWKRDGDADITPLMGVTLALWGLNDKKLRRGGSGGRSSSGREAVVL